MLCKLCRYPDLLIHTCTNQALNFKSSWILSCTRLIHCWVFNLVPWVRFSFDFIRIFNDKVIVGKFNLHVIFCTKSMSGSQIELSLECCEHVFHYCLIEQNWQVGIPFSVNFRITKVPVERDICKGCTQMVLFAFVDFFGRWLNLIAIAF